MYTPITITITPKIFIGEIFSLNKINAVITETTGSNPVIMVMYLEISKPELEVINVPTKAIPKPFTIPHSISNETPLPVIPVNVTSL